MSMSRGEHLATNSINDAIAAQPSRCLETHLALGRDEYKRSVWFGISRHGNKSGSGRMDGC